MGNAPGCLDACQIRIAVGTCALLNGYRPRFNTETIVPFSESKVRISLYRGYAIHVFGVMKPRYPPGLISSTDLCMNHLYLSRHPADDSLNLCASRSISSSSLEASSNWPARFSAATGGPRPPKNWY